MAFPQPHGQHKPTPIPCCAFSGPAWQRGRNGGWFTPRSPSSTILIFSYDEYCLRVAQRNGEFLSSGGAEKLSYSSQKILIWQDQRNGLSCTGQHAHRCSLHVGAKWMFTADVLRHHTASNIVKWIDPKICCCRATPPKFARG